MWELVSRKALIASTLTLPELIILECNFINLTDREFQCEKKIRELSKRKDAVQAISYYKKEKGCGVIRKDSPYELDAGARVYMCFCDYKHPQMSEILSYHRHYKNHFLPCAGGISNQPAKLMELIGALDRLWTEKEAKDMEEARQAAQGKRK